MTLPNTFVNGTLTDADDVNENFTFLDDKSITFENASVLDTNISTTSASFVDIPGMSVNINTAGTYLILLSMDVSVYALGEKEAEGRVQILKNSTSLARGTQEIRAEPNVSGQLSSQSHMNIHTIEACEIGDIIKVQWLMQKGTSVSSSNLINRGGRVLSAIRIT